MKFKSMRHSIGISPITPLTASSAGVWVALEPSFTDSFRLMLALDAGGARNCLTTSSPTTPNTATATRITPPLAAIQIQGRPFLRSPRAEEEVMVALVPGTAGLVCGELIFSADGAVLVN